MNKYNLGIFFFGKMIVCFILLMVLTACGNEKETNTVSMYDLRKVMLSADKSFPEMLSVSDVEENAKELFAYVSDVDYDKVEHFFISYSSEGLADEIVVIAVKDKRDVFEMKESLEKHRASRTRLYSQYMPKELARVEKGVIFYRDQYAVLIISDHVNEVENAFISFVD